MRGRAGLPAEASSLQRCPPAPLLPAPPSGAPAPAADTNHCPSSLIPGGGHALSSQGEQGLGTVLPRLSSASRTVAASLPLREEPASPPSPD